MSNKKIIHKKVDIYAGLTPELFNKLRLAFRAMKLVDLIKLVSSDPQKLLRIKKIIHKSYVLFLELIDVSWNIKDIPDVHVELYAYYDAMVRGEFTVMNNVVYRAFGKSAIKKNKTLRDILFRDQRYILYVNETTKQARADLEAVKYELRTNKIIKFLFGDVSYADVGDGKKDKTYNINRTIFYLNNDQTKWVGIEVYGMTSPIRGLILNGIRPTIVWLDDFESEKNSSSPNGRESVRDKIRKQILPIGQVGDFDMIFQGTIVHPKAWLAEVKEDFKDGLISAFCNEDSRYFERALSSSHDSFGEPTWGDLHDRKFWEAKRRMYLKDNEYWKFLQEYYNIPKQNADPSFKVDMITEVKYRYMSLGNIQWLEDVDGNKISCKTYIGIDPAYAFTARSDDTVITTIAVTPSGDIVILDMLVAKIDMTDKLENLFRLAHKYNPDKIIIEAFGAALELPHSFEREMWERKERYDYEVFKERVGKSTKFLNGLSPYINSGRFSYVSGCSNIDLMKFQMQSFSGEERFHDDTIDALFLAFHGSEVPGSIDIEARIMAYKKRNNTKVITNPYDQMMEATKVKTNIQGWRL